MIFEQSLPGHLGMGWFRSPLGASRTSSLRRPRGRRRRSPAPCCGTWPHSGRGSARKGPRATSWRSEIAGRRERIQKSASNDTTVRSAQSFSSLIVSDPSYSLPPFGMSSCKLKVVRNVVKTSIKNEVNKWQ